MLRAGSLSMAFGVTPMPVQNLRSYSKSIVMAGLEPATQGKRAEAFTARLFDPWVAGSRFACPAMTTEARGFRGHDDLEGVRVLDLGQSGSCAYGKCAGS
jgi:hypothetical protein